MKIRLRLGDADRERYGCPEWVEVDPFRVTWQETVALQAGVTVGGAPVAFDDPGAWRVSLTSDADQATRTKGVGVLVWLALRRADIKVPLADLDFDPDAMDYQVVADPQETPAPDAEGKDESVPAMTS